jgi:hypothetical protein
MSNDMLMSDIKFQVSSYHTNKILSGKGLEDDPEWVQKFEELIDAHEV